MKTLYLFILVAVAQGTASSSTVGGQPANISNNTTYMQTPAVTVIFRTDISSYFSANGLNAGSSNLLFPDNAVAQAYGSDPGNCVQEIAPFGTICSNYRFLCQAILAGSAFSNTSAAFNLVDLNALFIHKPDDPPGTCYLAPYMNSSGQAMLGMSAIVSYESSIGVADRISTMGWFAVLAGGGKALQPGHCMTFSVQYNPRAGDPQSFTWGDGTTVLRDVFQLIAVGNQDEPVQVSGQTCGVFESGSVKTL